LFINAGLLLQGNIHLRYPKLFSPRCIGNLKVKNRTVFAPISTNFASFASVTGEVTKRLIEHYYRIAQGGAGLITVENTCVHFPEGRHGATQPRINSDEFYSQPLSSCSSDTSGWSRRDPCNSGEE